MLHGRFWLYRHHHQQRQWCESVEVLAQGKITLATGGFSMELEGARITLTMPGLLQQLQPGMRRQVNDIRQGLGKQFDNFKKEVDGWLAKGRKTSADTGGAPARRSTGTPEHKPNSSAHEGKGNPSGSGNNAQPRQANAATQRTARFKQLSQKVLGVMGEHMADYHCQEVKGWGDKAAHDQAQVNSAKLNDSGRMVQLWPCVPRGRGIDAVWKSTGHTKPYAVIEAKASYDPTKSLRALLGVASRTIIWPLVEQVWMRLMPLFHGLHGCLAVQRGLR